MSEYSMTTRITEGSRSNRYYRNAVERHWDPFDIDLSNDADNFLNSTLLSIDPQEWGLDVSVEEGFDSFRQSIAMFGAGEDAVTEDLSPLAVVLEDMDDQMFITTQLYEEAKHAEFFDRYWKEVIHTIEDEKGWERTDPRDPKWFPEPYLELFERNKEATHRLLTDDTVENRAIAYCHYHMTIEGVLAQSGYYGLQTLFGDDEIAFMPVLPGLDEGISNIRSDEGRHVGFGMSKLKDYVESGQVDPALIEETLDELVELVVEALSTYDEDDQADEEEIEEVLEQLGIDGSISPGENVDVPNYARQKHGERMNQILTATEDIPDVDSLTTISSD
ncbi:MAG: ribonucleoside-diphosphate reductase [Natrialbaceae archaeon]|nr:ribonucleoside-diphosphate reductase [Natrialbaceae archaeon]